MSAAVTEKVRSTLAPVLAAAGYVLEDVVVRQAGSRRLVQVLVDREDGISLDGVAEASRAISDALDSSDTIAGAYVLEVSSPGVDRPLTKPRHWRRSIGRLVTVAPREGPTWTGRVVEADDSEAVLEVSGERRPAAYDGVRRAVVQVEFNRTASGSEAALDEDGEDA